MSKTPSQTPSKASTVTRTPAAQKSASKRAQKSGAKAPRTPAAAPAATTEEDDEEPQPAAKSAKKKQHNPTVAADANDDDAGEISLFHPSTAIHAAPAAAAESTAAAPATNGRHAADADAASSLTSPDFLRTLVASQTPDLLHVLRDLKTKLKEMRKQTVRPILRECKDGQMPTEEGMSFLELKSHLLLQYLQHLVFFVMCKLGGPSSESSARLSAVVRQLVYLRTVMEKLKPLDKKLRYQVEKMVKLANHMNRSAANSTDASAEGGAEVDDDHAELGLRDVTAMPSDATGEDPLSFRPDPSALLAATEDAARANADSAAAPESKLYRAPRITSTQLDDHERSRDKKTKALQRAQERAASSTYLQYMRGELSERPEEQRIDMEDSRPDAEEEERVDFEERNMLRLTDTRKDKARKREKARAAKNTLDGIDGGEFDDFRDIQRATRDLRDDDDMMSPDRMDQLQREAMSRKRGRGHGDDDGGDMDFDDPMESRHAKKRKGPNGKNPYGAKFRKSGGGRSGGGGGRGRR